ncbi:MAG: glutamine-hydrolyzing GMP synthase [Spirochaetaceae bacterium]|nr:MAG: glutamine-hydrolyzing GMP synthase [Spirochaetaceae bacterium]
MEKIIILDFGSQTTQLIGRRVREIGVYTEILPCDTRLTADILSDTRGIILSGSPESVYDKDSPAPDPAVYKTGLPILGICYGLQRTMYDNGGEVISHTKKEYGRARVMFEKSDPLLDGVSSGFTSWMSHGDAIHRLAPGFAIVAQTENNIPAVIRHTDKKIWGIQFHPEVTHCEFGNNILENFSIKICGCGRSWNVDAYFKQIADEVKQKVGKENVLLLISGGVDSTVVAALLLEALDPDQVYLMYIDTGLMRKGESDEVEASLKKLGAKHLHHINAGERFLAALAGFSEPEEKRKIIADMFIKVQETEVKQLAISHAYLAQGTLYTDLIESGKGVGKKAHVIKSHHNVRGPLVEAKRKAGLIIEPLHSLYKDEVRLLGKKLRLPESMIKRHPFPGPGLGVRILGEITQEKVHILQEADYIYISELKSRGLYDQIWQAFSVLLPLRSVGVSGDMRRYGYILSLRAVISHDGMTADVFPFPTQDLLEISSMITNQVKDVGRVVYDISSKPPATIEWE